MKVKNLKPDSKVAEYVERILVIDHSGLNMPFSLPLFANGSPGLLFVSVKGTIGLGSAAHLFLFGQTVFPETLSISEGFILIAYFFKPYALRSIFGVNATELTDKPVGLDLIISGKARALEERLLNAGSTEAMMALLDDHIAGLIAGAGRSDSSLIKYATNKIVHDPSPEILIQVQKELRVTERTFQRMFERNIGIAPNLYRRVCQFNSAFQQLNNRAYHKLSDIAFQHGYADQSHYVRSFKEFTNLIPTDYINLGSPPA